jgi:hypothetical protein
MTAILREMYHFDGNPAQNSNAAFKIDNDLLFSWILSQISPLLLYISKDIYSYITARIVFINILSGK